MFDSIRKSFLNHIKSKITLCSFGSCHSNIAFYTEIPIYTRTTYITDHTFVTKQYREFCFRMKSTSRYLENRVMYMYLPIMCSTRFTFHTFCTRSACHSIDSWITIPAAIALDWYTWVRNNKTIDYIYSMYLLLKWSI